MARALSVREGKDVVSWVASQSSDGTDSRGNLVAWVSGPEKSRHIKQDVAEGWDCGFIPGLGLLAIIFERSGRDATGTGGGALSAITGPGLGSLPAVSFAVGSSTLFIPNDSADLDVGGGSRGGSFL